METETETRAFGLEAIVSAPAAFASTPEFTLGAYCLKSRAP